MYRFAALLLSLTLAPAALAQLQLNDKDAIDVFLEESIENTYIPGVVAMVVDKDRVMYEYATGDRDSAAEIPMTVDTIFRIASMTKPVTSVAVMMLIEDGLMQLDDPISAYMPELANREVLVGFDGENPTVRPAATEITVRHLLTNTSGLAYSFSNAAAARMLTNAGDSAVDYPLVHEPGERWTYGESTRVLGRLVESLSGQSLEAFMRERIFEPLEMTETSYSVADESNERVATVHRMTGEGLVETPNESAITSPMNGDGGLNSTAGDYVKFIQMFLNGGLATGGTRLLSAATIDSMGEDHIGPLRVMTQTTTNPALSQDFPAGAGRDSFGLGFQITGPHDDRASRAPGSMAWAGIFNTEFWIDPMTGIGAVLLMQYLPFYDDAAIATLSGFEQRIYERLR